MNENIDLTQILKDCPIGSEFYSSIYGKVTFLSIDKRNSIYPIVVKASFDSNHVKQFTKQGKYYDVVGECILFPSKEQRDWNKFEAPWYKKDKFDPKTLQPFDRVLVKTYDTWFADTFSYYIEVNKLCVCSGLNSYLECIPYNDATKYLLGTSGEAPEYYRYWEN